MVCAAHQGLLTGLLARLDPDRVTPALEPFIRPGVCLITFGDARATGGGPEAGAS